MALILFLAGCSTQGDNSSKTPKDNEKGVESDIKHDMESDLQQGSEDVIKDNDENTGGNVDERAEDGYVFEVDGITIALNAKASSILEKLGEPMDYFEAKSCAFQGLDKIYTYSGFEMHTYEIDGVDHVLAVMFLDDSVSTKEGIYLSSDFDHVLQAYGDEYTQEQNVYTYELGKSKLSFMIEDDEVVSIEYMAITK